MGWFGRKSNRTKNASAARDTFARRPDVEADRTWFPPENDLLAVDDGMLAEMSDGAQGRYRQLLDEDLQRLKAFADEWSSDRSARGLEMTRRSFIAQSALLERVQALQFDQARRSGKFVDQLGVHPRAW